MKLLTIIIGVLTITSFNFSFKQNSKKEKNMNEKLNTKYEEILKEDILFIHGFPMNSSFWDSQVQVLNEQYNCYALDLPGYGTNLDQKNFNHSIDSYADYVFQYIKDKKLEAVHIVAMSMGGSIALNISRRYPEIVKSLVVIHTSAVIDTDDEKKKRSETIEEIKNGGLQEFINWFADRLLSPKSSNDIREKYIAFMQQASKEVVIKGYQAIRDREDEFFNLKNLKVPVLLVAGNDDVGSPPKEMREMASVIPNSTFKIIFDCGHMAPLEQPQRLNKILLKWFDTI